jgi:proteic killer suppression protein
VIKSFKNKTAEAVFNGETPKGFQQQIARAARRKLLMIHAATNLNDLRVPPSNHLEALKGSRKGQYSIRINDQFRVCFVWTPAGAENVEITDYH